MDQIQELELERDVPDAPLDTAAKRALIEAELRKDTSRSDRKIAEAVGHDICHKTVGAHRVRLGIASPGKTREELLLDTMPHIDPKSPAFVADAAKVEAGAAAEAIREKLGLNEKEENHFLPESESLVLPSQPAIAVYTNRYEQIVIRQEATGYQDDDYFVYICPQHLDALIVRLRKFLP